MTRTEAAARRRQVAELTRTANVAFSGAYTALRTIRQQRARGRGYFNAAPVYPEADLVARARRLNREGVAARRQLAALAS